MDKRLEFISRYSKINHICAKEKWSMSADDLTVAGIRFRSRADYEAALRDQKKINAIRARIDLSNPGELYKLFSVLQSGSYRFETQLGNSFDDEIYEKIEDLKRQGITPVNAGSVQEDKRKATAGLGKRKRTAAVWESPPRSPSLKSRGETAESQKKSRGKSSNLRLEDYDKEMQQQILDELKRGERRRKIVVAIASVVAAVSFAYFGIYYYFSARTSAEYMQLASLKGSTVLAKSQPKNEFSLHKQTIRMPDVLEEYQTLYQKNKKLIGWLKIDDTIIDYPVMQTSDNEYYLEHNFNQEYDKNGSLFLDYACSVYPRSTNLIIYGHHMKSGQMFGQLQRYAKESYGEKHSLIQFDSIYEKATYQVMYVFRSQVYNDDDFVFKYYQFIDANSEEEFNSYMSEMEEMSLYDTGVTASYGDSLLTLSTCDNSQTDGRFVVVAKRIQ